MEAKELRIGNYVENDIGDFILIDRDTLPFIVTKWIKCHHPILLTEEWLVKFGFVKNYYNDILNITGYWNKEKDCGIDLEQNEIFVYRLNGRKRTLGIVYVHQLQNLYFALTNEELTIK